MTKYIGLAFSQGATSKGVSLVPNVDPVAKNPYYILARVYVVNVCSTNPVELINVYICTNSHVVMLP